MTTSKITILEAENTHLAKTLALAKQDLKELVQEVIFYEQQIKKKDHEIAELRVKNQQLRDENSRTSQITEAYNQSQKLLERKDVAIQNMAQKEERLERTISSQEDKIRSMEQQVASMKDNSLRIELMTKEYLEYKQTTQDTLGKLHLQVNQMTEENLSLQEQLKSLLSVDLSKEERLKLLQAPYLTNSSTDFEERLRHSAMVTNTLKIASDAKERIKILEKEKEQLNHVIVALTSEQEEEKSVSKMQPFG